MPTPIKKSQFPALFNVPFNPLPGSSGQLEQIKADLKKLNKKDPVVRAIAGTLDSHSETDVFRDTAFQLAQAPSESNKAINKGKALMGFDVDIPTVDIPTIDVPTIDIPNIETTETDLVPSPVQRNEDSLTFLEALKKGPGSAKAWKKDVTQTIGGVTSILNFFGKTYYNLFADPVKTIPEIAKSLGKSPEMISEIAKDLYKNYSSWDQYKKNMAVSPLGPLQDMLTIASLGSGGTLKVAKVASAFAEKASTKATKSLLKKVAYNLTQVGQLIKPENIAKSALQAPLKVAQKIPGVNLSASVNPIVKATRAMYLNHIENSPLKISMRSSRIEEALSKLSPEDYSMVMPALRGEKIVGPMTPQLKQTLDLFGQEISLHEQTVGQLSKLLPEATESMAWQPLVSQTGLSIDDLKKITPQEKWPTYHQHALTDGVDIDVVLGTKKANITPQLSKKFIQNGGAQGYINDPMIFTKSLALRRQYLEGLKATDKAVKRWGIPLKAGEEVKPGYAVLDLNAIQSYSQKALENQTRLIQKLKPGQHIEDLLSQEVKTHTFRIYDQAKRGIIDGAHEPNLVQIPELVAREFRLQSYLDSAFKEATGTTGEKLFKSKSEWWIRSVLGWNVGWTINDAISLTMQNTLAGVGPKSYGRALQSKWKKIIPEEMSASGFVESQRKLGQLEKSTIKVFPNAATPEMKEIYLATLLKQSPAIIGRAIKKVHFKVSDVNFEINRKVNDYFRRARAIDELGKKNMLGRLNKTVESFDKANTLLNNLKILPEDSFTTLRMAQTAQKGVEEFLFNMADLGPIERSFLFKTVVPFYPFIKNMTKFTATMPVKYPARARVLREFALIANQISDEQLQSVGINRKDLPLWAEGSIIVGKDSETGEDIWMNAENANPYATILKIGQGNLPLSPVAQGVLALMGFDFFTKREVQDPDLIYRGGVPYLVDENGETPQSRGFNWEFAAEKILNSTPQTKLLIQLVTGGKKFRQGSLFQTPLVDPATNQIVKDDILLRLVDQVIPGSLSKKDTEKMLRDEAYRRKGARRDYNRRQSRGEPIQ